MTRTRTQTTLTRLAKLLASLNGELEFVEWLLEEMPEHREALTIRRESLEANRNALAATLRQFDPGLEVAEVGSVRPKKTRCAVQRYVNELQNP
jgi:hypothetical protein